MSSTRPKLRLLRVFAFLLPLLVMAGCAPLPAPDPAGSFSLAAFFEGTSVSRGDVAVLYLWSEPFTAGFTGTADGKRLRLTERFHFADGDPVQEWDMTDDGQGRYGGTVRTMTKDGAFAAPVPVEGYRTSDGALLSYDGYAPGGSRIVLHFRHLMRSLPDGTVSNDVAISKFGLPIARSQVVFSKAVPAG